MKKSQFWGVKNPQIAHSSVIGYMFWQYYLKFTEKAPEEITAVIKMHQACLFLITLISLFAVILALLFI